MSMAMRCFPGVSVGFPSGVPSHHTKDNWHNAKWVLWSRGELRIDSASFALVVVPDGGSNLAAKPFGVLTSASIITSQDPGGLCTFVATTNDPVHGVLRLNFQSIADEEGFVALAQAAEAASSGRLNGVASRRSSVGFGRRSSVCSGASGESLPEPLKAQLRERHPGAWPVMIGGAELYGPDPHGDAGSEVLLGRGAVVLLDPDSSPRVGLYEFLFYDESYAAPLLRLPVGPRLRLEPIREPAGGRRMSLDPGCRSRSLAPPVAGGYGAPMSFDLHVPGGGPWGLAFDHEADAAGFARDILVRQRLVQVSLKTSRGWRTIDELQDELHEMRRQGFLATMRRLLYQAVLLCIVSLFVYGCAIYSSQPERPPLDVAVMALQDAAAAVFAVGAWVADAGSVVCGSLVRSVPAADIERCVSLPEAVEVRSCAAALVGASSWTPSATSVF